MKCFLICYTSIKVERFMKDLYDLVFKMNKALHIIILLLLLFSAIILGTVFPSSSFDLNQEDWWNASWSYRNALKIYGGTEAEQFDYQILVVLNEKNFDFTNAKFNGDDIRFTDSMGNALNYWIEEWNPEDKSGRVWVKASKIPSTTNGAETIYMYYGNPIAEGTSNEKATFILGDTFTQFDGDRPNSSMWTDVYSTFPASPRFSPTDVQDQQLRVYVASSSSLWAFKGVRSRWPTGAGFVIDWRMKHNSATGRVISALYVGPMTRFENPPENPYQIKVTFEDWGPRATETFKVYTRIGESSHTIYSEPHVADDSMHDVRLIFRRDKYLEVYLDGSLRFNMTISEVTSTSGYVYLYSSVPGVMFYDTRFDDIRVRRYVYPEPRIEVWGEEKFGEQPKPSPTPMPTPTLLPTPTTTPSPSPTLILTPTPTHKPRPTWFQLYGAWIIIIFVAVAAFAAYLYLRRS